MHRIAFVRGLLPVLLRRLRYQIMRLLRRPIRSTNVLDYGADPYGILDSTRAIQHAIDSVSTLYFPVGKYISHPVQQGSNTSLYGDGDESTVIQMKSGK